MTLLSLSLPCGKEGEKLTKRNLVESLFAMNTYTHITVLLTGCPFDSRNRLTLETCSVHDDRRLVI